MYFWVRFNPKITNTLRAEIDLDFREHAPTFSTPEGFNHLRSYRQYMEQDRRIVSFAVSHELKPEPFSEVEIEILDALPDIPTVATKPVEGSTDFRNWVAFAARHAILILKRSPACPALTKVLTLTSHQESYNKLLPLLAAGGMTYKDLEIDLTGPSYDGRLHAFALKSGNVLPFGGGLPKASPSTLLWNSSDFHEKRTNVHMTSSLFELSDEISLAGSAAEMYRSQPYRSNISNPLVIPVAPGASSCDASEVTPSFVTSVHHKQHEQNLQQHHSQQQALPEHSRSMHVPSRVGNFLSVSGPVVYNIAEGTEIPSPEVRKVREREKSEPPRRISLSFEEESKIANFHMISETASQIDTWNLADGYTQNTPQTCGIFLTFLYSKRGINYPRTSQNIPRSSQSHRLYTPTWVTNAPSLTTNVSDVQGFCADGSWTTSFVLAPSLIVNAQNQSHRNQDGDEPGSEEKQRYAYSLSLLMIIRTDFRLQVVEVGRTEQAPGHHAPRYHTRCPGDSVLSCRANTIWV